MNWIDELRGRCIAADGAWSSELWARGVPRGAPAELANVTHAHIVSELAREYLIAGAKILSTNTFAANRLGLQQRKQTATARALNEAGAIIARRAADEFKARVVGVIGPSGTLLAVAERAPSELHEAFAEQARLLAEHGVDAILLETFSDVQELQVAIAAAKQSANLPLIACMSFDSGPQRTRTMMGAEAEAAAVAMVQAGADVIGCNCGVGAALALPAVVALRANAQTPLWVKPSVGLPELEDGRPVYRTSPEEFIAPLSTLIDAGANVIGGCCGAGPEHVRRIAALLESRGRAPRKRASG